MFFSLNNNAPVIGMDYSYSDEKCKKVSVYFKSMHSMIVDPSFLELMSMMNGVFDRESILGYAEKAHSYGKSYVNGIFDEMISWGVASEEKNACLWGESFDKGYSGDSFNRFDVRLLSVTPVLIDLALLLCKYNFNSISFPDNDIKIKQEDVDSSVLLKKSDVGCLLSDLITFRRNGSNCSGVAKHDSGEISHETILVCDGHSDNYSSECNIVVDANDYRNNSRFCRGLAFKMSNAGTQIEAQFIEFEHTLKIESDIVFGVVDGFYQ